jgi:hypothetical protein
LFTADAECLGCNHVGASTLELAPEARGKGGWVEVQLVLQAAVASARRVVILAPADRYLRVWVEVGEGSDRTERAIALTLPLRRTSLTTGK